MPRHWEVEMRNASRARHEWRGNTSHPAHRIPTSHPCRIPRILASGTLGFGESYMDGWWECDALDEMCCRAIRAGLEKRFAFRLPNVWALLTALVANQQTFRRSRKVSRVHYDLSNDFFEAMLDPNMQYSCALFAEGGDLARA